ncbi:MAG: 2-isopropylmalate synthase [Candidatus Dadabacteria bacterium]|nr:2-isopropylmalate synthase [Candidatus Dadabacteria bacterium]MYC40827.1 2-isopropylmalate synthase [Candidatus Dadabacteria bacterium]
MSNNNYIHIFDTTLRDGEQAPGCSMTSGEKLRVAYQLERLGVDIIEAGFPISSEEDFQSVKKIAQRIKGCQIAGLCRANLKDIDRGWEAVQHSESPRIHTFIATSEIHLKYKLRKTRDQVLEMISGAVKHARNYTDNVEFSCEDATRTDIDYLCTAVDVAVRSGATTINIPDTVGYTIPEEFAYIIHTLVKNVPNLDDVILSVHCHNDLGLAVANSHAAISEGARQVECTINGLGERAGNASLEEIVMGLSVRSDKKPYTFGINTTQIYPTSRLVSQVTGVNVQPNKAIVGANAFAHEAGIHQDGVLKESITYEIMTPQEVGIPSNQIVLGKHSGRHAFRDRLEEYGYVLEQEAFENAFTKFKALADKKKYVFDEDIEALINQEFLRSSDYYEFTAASYSGGTDTSPEASVTIMAGGEEISVSETGSGPVDAIFKAVKKATGLDPRLESFSVSSITGGTDAQGEVTVRIWDEGVISQGQGVDTDISVASAKAFVSALNRLRWRKEHPRRGSELKGI